MRGGGQSETNAESANRRALADIRLIFDSSHIVGLLKWFRR